MNVSEAVAGFGLEYLHWDERADELSVGFAGAIRPPFAPSAADHDHVRFRLSLTGVDRLRVAGWSHEGADRVTVRSEGDRVLVAISGPGCDIECHAAAAAIADTKSFRAGPM